MATRLQIYNRAARMLGETRLADLTEDRSFRHEADAVWDDSLAERCLSEGLWNFAIRTVKVTYDPAISPGFGYQRAFQHPTDFLRTVAVSASDRFDPPLLDYEDKAGHWWADYDTIYLQYVSSDASYGLDTGLWPPKFSDYVAAQLAYDISMQHTGSDDRATKVGKARDEALSVAKNIDAMNQPSTFPARGSWARARHGGGGNRDRGNSGQLIG